MFCGTTFKIFKFLLLWFVLTSILSSCNLFRYGIEERRKEKAFESEKNKSKEANTKNLGKIKVVLNEAQKYEGTPYLLGGESKKGIDCSALVMLSYKNAGIALPRTTAEQSKIGNSVTLQEAQPGDLIFFNFKKSKNKNGVNHVGIISKVNKNGTIFFYHASTSLGVTESSLEEPYYKSVFVKIQRLL